MTWPDLEPAHALPPGDERYVPRPWGGGDRVAMLVRNGLAPVAITGLSGNGKTTELHRAVAALRSDRLAIPIGIRELAEPEDLTYDLLLFRVAELLIERMVALDPDVIPPQGLIDDLRASDPRFSRGHGKQRPPLLLAQMAILEVSRSFGKGRPALLFDGIDHLRPDLARELVRTLLELRDHCELVVVVSPTLTNGPESHELLVNFRVHDVPCVPVREDADLPWKQGRAWLRDVLRRRLDAIAPDAAAELLIERAAATSGGNPRLFLELLQDATGYASARELELPDEIALSEAIRDHAEALRRLVVAGDLDALVAADGTTGLEVDPARRVRFLSNGLLLEYAHEDDVVVHPSPLLQRLIERHRR